MFSPTLSILALVSTSKAKLFGDRRDHAVALAELGMPAGKRCVVVAPTARVMAQVDMLTFSPKGYILAGVSF